MSQFLNATDAPDGSDGPGIGTGTLLQALQVSTPAHSTINLPGTFQSYYVGNVAGLLAFISSGSDVFYSCQFNFSEDFQGLFTIAQFNYAKTSHLYTVDEIPVCAPFLNIVFGNNSAGPILSNLTVQTLSGNVPGIGGINGNVNAAGRMLAHFPFGAIAANATIIVNADSYIPGPGTITVFSSGGAGFAFIQTKVGNISSQPVGLVSFSGGTGQQGNTGAVVLPNDDWDFRITNTLGTSQNFLGTVMTGR